MDTTRASEGSRYWLAGGSVPVPHLTIAGMRFAAEHSRLIDLHLFFSEAKLEKLSGTSIAETPAAIQLLAEMAEHDGLLAEVILCRTVDNYLCYVTELLALIYKARPETLRTSEQERLDFILQYESMDELRTAIAEKRVERLSYLGLRDLANHLQATMAFDLFLNAKDQDRASLLIEYRNLIVHTRGIVSTTSARKAKELRSMVGTRINIHPKSVRETRQFLENAVIDTDVRAAEKFALPVAKIPTPPEDL